MNLVEESQYDHDEWGRVLLVTVDEDADEVYLMRSEPIYIRGTGYIPAGARESIATFREHAEPANLTIRPPSVKLSASRSGGLRS